MPLPPEIPLLLSLVILLLIAIIVRYPLLFINNYYLRIPPRYAITFITISSAEILYLDWLEERFNTTPILTTFLRLFICAIICVVINYNNKQQLLLTPTSNPTIFVIIVIGLLWGIDEILACKTCIHNVQAVVGSLGLIIAGFIRLIVLLIRTKQHKRRQLIADNLPMFLILIFVGIPLSAIASFLTLPFSFHDGFGISSGLILTMRMIILEIFITSGAAPTTNQSPTPIISSGHYRLLLIMSGVSSVLCFLVFLSFELPAILSGKQKLDVAHPLELIMLTIPGSLLTLAMNYSAIELIQITSTTAMLSCTSFTNFMILWIILGESISVTQCHGGLSVLSGTNYLLVRFVGTLVGIVGCVVEWRSEPLPLISADQQDQQQQHECIENATLNSSPSANGQIVDLGNDEIFTALEDSLPPPKILEHDETDWLLRDDDR
jgi:hypothetical protein